MRSQKARGFAANVQPAVGRPAFRAFIGAALAGSLAACGGSGSSLAPTPVPHGQFSTGYAYVTSADFQGQPVPGAVYQYAIGADGSLTPLSIPTVATGATPTAIVADPSGRYVYVGNQGDATISQYAIGAGGGLSALAPAAVSLPGPSLGAASRLVLSVDPSGRFLYAVTNPPLLPPQSSSSIAQFSIGSDGTLTPLMPASITLAGSASGSLAIDQAGEHAYLAVNSSEAGGEVLEFSIGSGGALAPLLPASVAAPSTPFSVVLPAGSQSVYALSVCVDNLCDGQVSLYALGAGGALSSTGALTLTASHVDPLMLVSDGSHAYLLTNLMGVDTDMGAVYQYSIGGSGALAPLSPASVALATSAVAEALDGTELFVLSSGSVQAGPASASGGCLDRFVVGTDGTLSSASSTPVAANSVTAMALVLSR